VYSGFCGRGKAMREGVLSIEEALGDLRDPRSRMPVTGKM
jgi:hypothetical protein